MNNKGLGGTLPPLPPSDQESMDNNRYDGFYKVRTRNFWADAEIIRIDNTPPKKCEHKFTYVSGGVKCGKCHFGLAGPGLEVQNGKLFHKGKQIPEL